MADQQSRGGQKKGANANRGQAEQHRGTKQTGERSSRGKRNDQVSNPDDASRRATNERR
ncbi:MAG: hypothetical protein ACJ8C4_09025 [Gemmataceae bacterium]